MTPDLRVVPARRKTLLWLASYPKSGSTWMRMFIYAYLGDGTVQINNAVNAVDMAPELYEKVSPIPLAELGVTECFHLRPAALFGLVCTGEDQIVKTHCCNGFANGIELIPRVFTRGAIYVVRDPRDIAVSYADHMAKSIDETIDMMNDFALTSYLENLSQYLSTWSNHVLSWTEKVYFKVLAVRYEEMLSDPHKAFRHVAYFLTGGCDEEKLDKCIEACRFENLRKQEEQFGFREKSPKQERFFRKGKSSWREILTPEQVARIERDHGEAMEKLGYK